MTFEFSFSILVSLFSANCLQFLLSSRFATERLWQFNRNEADQPVTDCSAGLKTASIDYVRQVEDKQRE